jgi:membrane-associated phospholipid phosphatase
VRPRRYDLRVHRFRLFEGSRTTLAGALSRHSLAAYTLAVALTLVLVASGADQRVHDALLAANPFAFDALVFWGGFWLPTAFGIVLLAAGLGARRRALESAGWAVLQAVVFVAALTFVVKWLTGRPGPMHGDDAREFHLLRSGLSPFYVTGYFFWPSGHTSSAVAAASAFAAFHGVRRPATLVVLAGALAIAASMLAGSYHWLSDIPAGALLAWPIGWNAGRRFREHDVPK